MTWNWAYGPEEMSGSSWVRMKSARSTLNSSAVGRILCASTWPRQMSRTASTYFSSSLIELGKTAEKVFCSAPTDRVVSSPSLRSRLMMTATAEESRPPDSEVPTGTSDCSRRRTASVSRAWYSLAAASS